jgi:hypothetical protein
MRKVTINLSHYYLHRDDHQRTSKQENLRIVRTFSWLVLMFVSRRLYVQLENGASASKNRDDIQAIQQGSETRTRTGAQPKWGRRRRSAIIQHFDEINFDLGKISSHLITDVSQYSSLRITTIHWCAVRHVSVHPLLCEVDVPQYSLHSCTSFQQTILTGQRFQCFAAPWNLYLYFQLIIDWSLPAVVGHSAGGGTLKLGYDQ